MSSKGTSTFILQRLTAVLLIPIVIWFLWSLAAHAGASFVEMKAWIAAPKNAIMFAALITIGAFHMRIGLGEVIDDYLQRGARTAASAFNWLISLAVIAVTYYSLYLLAF